MRRVSTATCTSGDPVSPACGRFSRIVSSCCSTTANLFFRLFIFFYLIRPVRSFMLPHASHRIVRCNRLGNGPGKVLLPQTFGDEPGLLHVALDLLSELANAGEPTLFPYTSHKTDVHLAPVEIAVEVQEMGLDTALGTTEGGSHPHVRTRGMLFFADADEPGVDP